MEDRDKEWGSSVDVEPVMELKEGDVVRLAGSVTRAEFGLALCDDEGELLQIDGKVWKTGDCGVYVVMKRMRPRL